MFINLWPLPSRCVIATNKFIVVGNYAKKHSSVFSRVSVEKKPQVHCDIFWKCRRELVKVIFISHASFFCGIALCWDSSPTHYCITSLMINALEKKRQKTRLLGCMSQVHFPLTLLEKVFHSELLLFSSDCERFHIIHIIVKTSFFFGNIVD